MDIASRRDAVDLAFRGSTGWAALPSRPVASARNPPLCSGSPTLLRPFGCSRPLTPGLFSRISPPTPLSVKGAGDFERMEDGHGQEWQAAEPREERRNLYAKVTSRFIAKLEAGRFPWVQPWESAKAELGLAENAATKRGYSRINILIL